MIIVNSDDFGMSKGVTDAILEAFRRKYISQTTLMVTMPDADRAVELAKQNGYGDRIGLHLNLTEGTPLTNSICYCPEFCSADGKFDGSATTHGRRFVSYPRKVEKALGEEIEAQVLKFKDYHLPLMHCDSHHHVHTWLSIARVLFPILEKHGFKTVRRPLWGGGLMSPKFLVREFRNYLFLKVASFKHLHTADRFCDWRGMTQYVASKDSSIELMVHVRYDLNGCLANILNYKENSGIQMEEIGCYLQKLGEVVTTYSEIEHAF